MTLKHYDIDIIEVAIIVDYNNICLKLPLYPQNWQ